MSKFRTSSIECKLGMTVELKGTWVRVDRGMTFDVPKGEQVTLGDIKAKFDQAQAILIQEVEKAIESATTVKK